MRPETPFLACTKIEFRSEYFDVVNGYRPSKPNLCFAVWPSYPRRPHDIVSIKTLNIKGVALRPRRQIWIGNLIRICVIGIRSHPNYASSTTLTLWLFGLFTERFTRTFGNAAARQNPPMQVITGISMLSTNISGSWNLTSTF